MGVFMFHVKFVHYMLKKRQLATRPLMCPRLFKICANGGGDGNGA
jgi:hypothetical protein